MPDEAPAYRSPFDLGFHPIAGGAEGDEPPQDQPPSTPAPAPTDQAPEDEGTPPEDQFPDDLDLSAVPEDTEEARKWIAQRHKQMQGAMTRATQSAAEIRREAEQFQSSLKDPESFAQVARELGYDFAEAEPGAEQEYQEPEEALRAELEEVKAYLAQRGEAEEYDAYVEADRQYADQRLAEIEAHEGNEFNDQEKNLILSYARANRKPDGEPDVAAGRALLAEYQETDRKAYLESKRAPRAPGGGKPASRQVDPENEEEVLQSLADRYDALAAANQPEAA